MALCQEETRFVLLLLKTIISAVHTGVATSHRYNDPITAANEAYGMHSLTVSTDQKLSTPVYEQVETKNAN